MTFSKNTDDSTQSLMNKAIRKVHVPFGSELFFGVCGEAENSSDPFLLSGGIGSGASGSLPIGDTSRFTEGTVIFVGGPNVVFGPHSDWGDPKLTDTGFTAQPVVTSGSYSNYQVRPRETLNLNVDYSEPMVPLAGVASVAGDLTIDIHRTKIYDTSSGERQEGYLSSLIKRIDEDGNLVLDGEALIAVDDVEKSFDFKYDEEGDKLGAGTAFLQD